MSESAVFELKPIAYFKTRKKEPYQAARQGTADLSEELGEIHFLEGNNFEQALDDIEGFSHFWLIYNFHQNQNWKPKVMPPRGSDHKVGVFSTRSPYRPNQLGLSCVEFVRREGLVVFVKHFDLLDGTPIFDLKPYLPYADSFPEAKAGWLENVEKEQFLIEFKKEAQTELDFLESEGLLELSNFIHQQLSFDPTNAKKKRVQSVAEHHFILSYRTWRIHFHLEGQKILISEITSGYTPAELSAPEDPYGDKDLHRRFLSFRP